MQPLPPQPGPPRRRPVPEPVRRARGRRLQHAGGPLQRVAAAAPRLLHDGRPGEQPPCSFALPASAWASCWQLAAAVFVSPGAAGRTPKGGVRYVDGARAHAALRSCRFVPVFQRTVHCAVPVQTSKNPLYTLALLPQAQGALKGRC